MNRKKIALIGYSPANYFKSFGETLEDSSFEVFWVHITRSAAIDHRNLLTTPPEKILDTTENFRPDITDIKRYGKELEELEYLGSPRINDIILMDRILRNKSYAFALCYLNHLQSVLLKFFLENSIALVSSGRDSALQLISMLVSNKLNIPWIVPTRIRIPQEMYMFTSGHTTSTIINIRAPNAKDRLWAKEFLKNLNLKHDKPALKAATRNLSDVLKMMPTHTRLFLSNLGASFAEKGNNFSRYTVFDLMLMYLKRRFNMLALKIFPPYSSVGKQPFCLYALHTQPESSIDVAGSYFSDQIALITFITRSLPASHELYVKIHPTDLDGKSLLFYKRLARLPGVRLIYYDVDSKDLAQRALIIFTLTGTIGYEAGLMGKWVITFAKNYYNSMPTVRYCESPPALPALIEVLLKSKPPDDLHDRLIEFMANLKAQSFEGEFNRMYLPIIEPLIKKDLLSLQEAYNCLYYLLVPPLSSELAYRKN
ncbi:MAG: hypothetical protein FJY58_07290 [Betaproteobacteria bacterium]|nr:hypothetical protein [Betaproteobacteria bacterium]